MLCGFLGTAWRTVALLCQASLYSRGPLGCSSPGHSRGWKGILLASNWKDATLNSVNANILYPCTVVAEMLTAAMAEAGPLSWDKPHCHSNSLQITKQFREAIQRQYAMGCPATRVSPKWPCAAELETADLIGVSCIFGNHYVQQRKHKTFLKAIEWEAINCHGQHMMCIPYMVISEHGCW